MGDEGEGAHEEEQDCGTVLRVAVQLSGHSYQSQEPCCFEQANQCGGLGLGGGRGVYDIALQVLTHINRLHRQITKKV